MRRLLLLTAIAAGGALGLAGTARADGLPPALIIPAPDIHRDCLPPHASSVTWPSVTPPGWYTNTYRHQWYFPWYAYYDFSMGPYANWTASGGRAGYADHGPAGMYYSHKPPAQPYIGEWYYREQERAQQREQQKAEREQRSQTGTTTQPPAVPDTMPKKDEKPKEEDKGGTVSVTLPADAKLLFNGVAANGTGGVRTFQTPPLQAGQIYQYELTAEIVRGGQTERATSTVIVRAGETSRAVLTPIPVPVIAASVK